MRCLTCHYDLRNLAEHRCPECGRGFDPSDRRTFYPTKLHLRLWRLRRRSLVTITISMPFAYLFACVWTWLNDSELPRVWGFLTGYVIVCGTLWTIYFLRKPKPLDP
jgi:hypothetical protein